jgi:hypothetical protein
MDRRRIPTPFPYIPEGGVDRQVEQKRAKGSPCRTPVRDRTLPYKSEASLGSKYEKVESREYTIYTSGII